MKTGVKVLYISYDGMTDPLGQSQVIPYLLGLSKRDVQIHILSAEKHENFKNRENYIGKLLYNAGIIWHPISYSKKPPIISTLIDIIVLKNKAKKLNKYHGFDIVHCRSYISAFVGHFLKRKYKVKFLFDMRGFYADERIEGNIWKLSNPIFRFVYNYFKHKENIFLSEADYTISLTKTAKKIIHNSENLTNIPIEVIPCCADLDLFNYNDIDYEKVRKYKSELNLDDNNFVISYLGSIGTWYMLDEMMSFFKILKSKEVNAKFLFITKDNPEIIINSAQNYGVDIRDILIKGEDRESVPSLLYLSKLSIFFIKPLFSKKASSPTKLAELLGMGIPIICNSDIGDVDRIFSDNKIGILLKSFDEESYLEAINKIDTLSIILKEHLRSIAQSLFSLNVGIDKYYEVYSKMLD